MIYRRAPSFFRSLRAIADQGQLEAIQKAMETLVQAFETRMPPPPGLGLKRLQKEIWEIRSGLRDRVLFLWYDDSVTFTLAGNHQDIRRFLKS